VERGIGRWRGRVRIPQGLIRNGVEVVHAAQKRFELVAQLTGGSLVRQNGVAAGINVLGKRAGVPANDTRQQQSGPTRQWPGVCQKAKGLHHVVDRLGNLKVIGGRPGGSTKIQRVAVARGSALARDGTRETREDEGGGSYFDNRPGAVDVLRSGGGHAANR